MAAPEAVVDRDVGDGADLGLDVLVKGGVPAAAGRPTLSVIEASKPAAAQTEVEVLEVVRTVLPPGIAASLRLENGAPAVHARRLRRVGRRPVMLTDAWVPVAWGKGVSFASLKKRALYEVLMAHGVRFGRMLQEISAQLADPGRATLLRIEVGSPLLELVRLMHDLDDRPVQHLTAYLPPERSRILMDIPGDSVNTLSAGQIVHELR